MQLNKARLVLIVLAILVSVAGLLYYLFYKSVINLDYFTKSSDITFPTTTVAEGEADTGSLWVWLENVRSEQSVDSYYLVGNLYKVPKTTVKILLGKKERKMGYAFATEPQLVTPDLPQFFPRWTSATAEEVANQSVNTKHAIIKIFTKQQETPADCSESCHDFIAGQALLQNENNTIETIDTHSTTNELTIGPAVQILFFSPKND